MSENTGITQPDVLHTWKPSHGMITNRLVAVEDIIVDELYQMRTEGTDPTVVEKYAAIMEDNDPDGWAQFPPIRVLPHETEDKKLQYKIVSGFHRHAAIIENGYDEVHVEMVNGEEMDGLIIALGQNTDRSQPRTQKDINNMMEFCLTHPEIRLWSNNQIARWCAVSPQTVSNHENRLLSTSNLEIDARPDELKFIDKHGNISLRKRLITKEEKTIGAGLLITPKGDVVDADEDAEQIEREHLVRDITNTFITRIRPFVFNTDPTIFAQREAALIEEYPLLELYSRLDSLGIEDLRAFFENLEKVVAELSDRKSNLRHECRNLHEEEIRKRFPTGQTTHEEDQQWEAALEAAFPAYSQFQSLWSLSFYEICDLKAVMLKIVAHLKENGVDAYLPKSFTERKAEAAQTEADDAESMKLAKAVGTLREQVSDAIIKIADAEELSLSKRDMAVSIFRSVFNKAQPDDALSKDKAMRFQWDMEKLPAKEVKEIKAYWQKMKKVCAETPQPSWIDDSVRSFRCQLSSIKITGSRDYELIGKEITIVPQSPLSDDEMVEVVKAAQKAAKEKAMCIHLHHTCGTNGKEK